MTQALNQFAQTPEKGLVDLLAQGGTITVQFDPSSSGALVPGQCVKIVDSAGPIPKVIAITATTDDVFGVVNYDVKKNSYAVGDYLEISALHGNIVYMEASAAIARYAKVMPVISGSKVVTAATTGNVIIGRAYDKAAANGDLIRVVIDLPASFVP